MGTISPEEFGEYDFELSRMMTAYWANFAKTGNPNGPGLKNWPLYTLDEPVSMHLPTPGTRLSFWRRQNLRNGPSVLSPIIPVSSAL